MRFSACDTVSRYCARPVLCDSHSPRLPPLAPPTPQPVARLCSSASQLLWRIRLLMIVHRRLRLLAFPTRTSEPQLTLANRGSAGTRAKSVRTCQCLRPRRAVWALALSRPSVLPSVTGTTSTRMGVRSRVKAGLCAPLSTLRQYPHGYLRINSGRCGSLLLHRDGLAPSTPCRSPGALRSTPNSGHGAALRQMTRSARNRPPDKLGTPQSLNRSIPTNSLRVA